MKKLAIVVAAGLFMQSVGVLVVCARTFEVHPGAVANEMTLEVVNGYDRTIPAAVVKVVEKPSWMSFASLADTVFEALEPGESALVHFRFEVSPKARPDLVGEIKLIVNSAGGREQHSLRIKTTLPSRVVLHQSRPNPFSATTAILYMLPGRCDVSLKVYDLAGRVVSTLVNTMQDRGAYTIEWRGTNDEGRPLPSGAYFYRLTAGDFEQTKKIILIR